MADDQHVRAGRGPAHVVGDAGLLRAGHQVVDEHADASLRPGPELAQLVRQVVDAAEMLDDDALEPQVVAPDLLDQLGIVATLDEDPALAGHPGPHAGDGHRSRRRTTRGRRSRSGHGSGQHHRAPLEEEARAQGEGTPAATSVLQREHVEVAVDRDDLTAPVGHHLFDDQPHRRLSRRRPASCGCAPVGGEDVGGVAVGCHRATLGRGSGARLEARRVSPTRSRRARPRRTRRTPCPMTCPMTCPMRHRPPMTASSEPSSEPACGASCWSRSSGTSSPAGWARGLSSPG